MWTRSVALAVLIGGPALAEEPLSAIDWLNPDSAPTVAGPAIPPAGATAEPPVADAVTVPDVDSAPLGEPSVEAVGLLPPATTGLPPDLWAASRAARLVRLVEEVEPAVPAMAALLNTLLLAEAHPPLGADEAASFLAARVSRLIETGAVDPALALLERAGPRRPELFALWFDAALLEGRAAAPCEALADDGSLSEDLPTEIFCAARNGDWPRAMLSYQSAKSLGTLAPRDRDLLERFLEPEYAEGLPALPPPSRPTALQFELFEAIGEPLPTARLPRAFAATDLSGDKGWKAQLHAAERLARAGALSENRLLGIYTLRQPAASGGIWDRVEAFQRFDIAMTARNPTAVAEALVRVWPEMEAAGLLVPFATLYGERLMALPLTGEARRLALSAGLLSPAYERAAALMGTGTAEAEFLSAVAQGRAPAATPDLPHAAAIAAAFAGAAPPDDIRDRLEAGQLGEAILMAMDRFATGAAGNDPHLTGALASLRSVGLEDSARRAALQLALLDQVRGGP